MKFPVHILKAVTALFLISAGTVDSWAGNPFGKGQSRFSIESGVGVWPYATLVHFSEGTLFADRYTDPDAFYTDGRQVMSYMYGDYDADIHAGPVLNLSLEYRLSPRFSLSADLYFDSLWKNLRSSVTNEITTRQHGMVLSVIPQIRFTSFKRESLTLYSSIGGGLGFYRNFRKMGTWDVDEQSGEEVFKARYVAPELILCPIGITVGRKVYAFGEFGFGTAYMGVTGGIGYRF